MSDYTVKREKEGILRIQAEGTKMPGPLTINERDYADDKQLIIGGGSSSPLGLAKVKLMPKDQPYSVLTTTFDMDVAMPVCAILPEEGARSSILTSVDLSFSVWDEIQDSSDNVFLITPYLFYRREGFDYEIEGNAETGTNEDGDYILVTGDCTITVSRQDEINE